MQIKKVPLSIGKYKLVVHCRECRRRNFFSATSLDDCIAKAIQKGWVIFRAHPKKGICIHCYVQRGEEQEKRKKLRILNGQITSEAPTSPVDVKKSLGKRRKVAGIRRRS